jgi:iron complex transport system substrate-binding protein
MKSRLSVILSLLLIVMGVMPIFAQDTDEAEVEEETVIEYPITIEHQFGSTTLEAFPERIVSIGYTEQDYLLAFGVVPVGVRYWYGEEEDTIRPWAVEFVEVEDEEDLPVILNFPFGGINYEAILELQPDLISAVTAGLTEEEYLLLSEIAPVLTQSADFPSFGMPWPEVTLMIGEALNMNEEAEALVEETQNLFDQVIEENPQFVGKSAAVGYYFENLGVFTEQDNRGDFFTRLGFVIPEEVTELAGESFYVDLSPERLDILDQDVLALVNVASVEGGIEALEADPLYSLLNVVEEGRVIYLTAEMEDAISFNSPLSLAFAIESIVPELQALFPAETAE